MGQVEFKATLPSSLVEDEKEETLEKYQKKRTRIVTEIVETEKSYVESLKQLYVKWEKPLRDALSGKPILGEEDIKAIFSISNSLLCLHELMLKSLITRLENWSKDQLIGDIFLLNGNALKFYTEYVNHYNNGLLVLNKKQKDKDFSDFVHKNGGQLTLTSLLIQPIQRIPRYQMLITDLVKNTWTSHEDYRKLLSALEMIIEAASFVNEQKRIVESTERLLEIQSLLKGSTLSKSINYYAPSRLIISEGEAIKRSSHKSKKLTPVNYCIMSDKILIWRIKKPKPYLFCNLKDTTINANENICRVMNGKYFLDLVFNLPNKLTKFVDVFSKAKKKNNPDPNDVVKQRAPSQSLSLTLLSEQEVSHTLGKEGGRKSPQPKRKKTRQKERKSTKSKSPAVGRKSSSDRSEREETVSLSEPPEILVGGEKEIEQTQEKQKQEGSTEDAKDKSYDVTLESDSDSFIGDSEDENRSPSITPHQSSSLLPDITSDPFDPTDISSPNIPITIQITPDKTSTNLSPRPTTASMTINATPNISTIVLPDHLPNTTTTPATDTTKQEIPPKKTELSPHPPTVETSPKIPPSVALQNKTLKTSKRNPDEVVYIPLSVREQTEEDNTDAGEYHNMDQLGEEHNQPFIPKKTQKGQPEEEPCCPKCNIL